MMSPCYECKERHSGCHSNCELYDEFKKKNQKQRDARKAECQFYNYAFDASYRVKKRRDR